MHFVKLIVLINNSSLIIGFAPYYAHNRPIPLHISLLSLIVTMFTRLVQLFANVLVQYSHYGLGESINRQRFAKISIRRQVLA